MVQRVHSFCFDKGMVVTYCISCLHFLGSGMADGMGHEWNDIGNNWKGWSGKVVAV